MSGRARLLALLGALAGIALFLKRPVKQPRSAGSWEPAERHRSPR